MCYSGVMAETISIRLDVRVREILEDEAEAEGIGIATYLRRLAAQQATDVMKARIRTESRQIGELTQKSESARSFYSSWGTPTTLIDDDQA